MVQVTAEEAKARLPELIAEAITGETAVITQDGQQAVQLVPITYSERRPQFGSAKGLITIADDFDAPLEGFDEYSSKKEATKDPILAVLGTLSFDPMSNEEIDTELYGPADVHR